MGLSLRAEKDEPQLHDAYALAWQQADDEARELLMLVAEDRVPT